MAKATKHRPWIVEMQGLGLPGWYECGAYTDEERAAFEAAQAAKQAPKAKWRYRRFDADESTAKVMTPPGVSNGEA